MASTLSPDQATIIKRTRDAMQGQTAISQLQKITTTEQEVKVPSHISKQTFFSPQEEGHNICHIVYNAIKDLGSGNEKLDNIGVANVEVRWTGCQPNIVQDEIVSEKENFDRITKAAKHPVTILYFIGGGFYMGIPSRYHSTTTNLARKTGGRCFSFSYRLSPKNAFPAALIDCLFTYLTLLYPTPSYLHDPVPASSIIFAGDSAGANLALALIQLILSAKNRGEKVLFNNELQNLPLPSGLAVLSAGPDMTYSLASEENLKYDIFDGKWSFLKPGFPTCSLWPTNPPRAHIYADKSLLTHPLVSPCIAKSWKGAPPMWFAGGEEVMAVAVRLVVQEIAKSGGKVRYEEYEEMPHDFAIMEENWPWAVTGEWKQSVRCMENWAEACVRFSEGSALESKAVFVETDGNEKVLELKTLSGLSWEEANELMMTRVEDLEVWTGKK